MKKYFTKSKLSFLIISFFLLLTSCEENKPIVNNISEKEANEILVILASKGIEAQKIQAESTAVGGAATTEIYWNISVDKDKEIEAMAILNRIGLPRRKGQTLLEIFKKEGFMTSEKQENIRYQAGLEEELRNIIRKIDGVLDAAVQISFPSKESLMPGEEQPKMKAAVYVKHQGILDDPNNHLETKIKRLLSGAVEGLDFESVSVISDKSYFSDLRIPQEKELISPKIKDQHYVNIWSMVMTKSSATRFRIIFFIMIVMILIFGAIAGFFIYKFYPMLKPAKKTEKTEEKEE